MSQENPLLKRCQSFNNTQYNCSGSYRYVICCRWGGGVIYNGVNKANGIIGEHLPVTTGGGLKEIYSKMVSAWKLLAVIISLWVEK